MASIRKYKKISGMDFFTRFNREDEIRDYLWILRFGKVGFRCPKCEGHKYWELETRPEVRQCTQCQFQVRLRVGTLFQDSKLPLLTWVRAIYFVMQGKRGISALELKRLLKMKSYGTTWMMLMKIRKSLADRDAGYKLGGTIEIDGAFFNKEPDTLDKKEGRVAVKHSVLVAVERKDFIDERGRKKSRAGFAKVMMDLYGQETKKTAEKFVKQSVRPRAILNTDGRTSYKTLPKMKTNMKTISGSKEDLDKHLPWVSKFTSNAKTWLLGTHHGIESKYLSYYLSEYTYRFNRRHDPDGLFDRALRACIHSSPTTQHALTG
jgi:hypothetical protein